MAYKLFSSPADGWLGWRERTIAGWSTPVGEDRVSLPLLIGDTIGLLALHGFAAIAILSTFMGTALGRTIGINYPRLPIGQPSKLVLFIRVFT